MLEETLGLSQRMQWLVLVVVGPAEYGLVAFSRTLVLHLFWAVLLL